jgi:hypothetical protein
MFGNLKAFVTIVARKDIQELVEVIDLMGCLYLELMVKEQQRQRRLEEN